MSPSLYSALRYTALAIGVVIIGGLIGWFFVLRSQTQSTISDDAARGFGVPAPAGSSNGATFSNGINTIDKTSQATDAAAPPVAQLWHVDTTPVAGFGFTIADAHAVFFAEKATGHIFRADLETGESHRLSNTLTPKTQEALFARDGKVILRNTNEHTGAIESLSGKVGTSSNSAPASLIGVNLENNIKTISANPDAQTLFYILQDAGVTLGITASWNGTNEKRVFSSPVGSWRPLLLADGRLFVSQMAADYVRGYAYEIKKDGSLRVLARAIPGLTLLPQASTTALLFGSSGDTLSLFLQASSTAKTIALPIKTTADKCAWGPAPLKSKTATSSATNFAYCAVPASLPAGNFLSSWYQGSLHTSDSLWRVNAETGETQLIYSPESDGEELDVIHMFVDPNGRYLGFINSRDASFWILRLGK